MPSPGWIRFGERLGRGVGTVPPRYRVPGWRTPNSPRNVRLASQLSEAEAAAEEAPEVEAAADEAAEEAEEATEAKPIAKLGAVRIPVGRTNSTCDAVAPDSVVDLIADCDPNVTNGWILSWSAPGDGTWTRST